MELLQEVLIYRRTVNSEEGLLDPLEKPFNSGTECQSRVLFSDARSLCVPFCVQETASKTQSRTVPGPPQGSRDLNLVKCLPELTRKHHSDSYTSNSRTAQPIKSLLVSR